VSVPSDSSGLFKSRFGVFPIADEACGNFIECWERSAGSSRPPAPNHAWPARGKSKSRIRRITRPSRDQLGDGDSGRRFISTPNSGSSRTRQPPQAHRSSRLRRVQFREGLQRLREVEWWQAQINPPPTTRSDVSVVLDPVRPRRR